MSQPINVDFLIWNLGQNNVAYRKSASWVAWKWPISLTGGGVVWVGGPTDYFVTPNLSCGWGAQIGFKKCRHQDSSSPELRTCLAYIISFKLIILFFKTYFEPINTHNFEYDMVWYDLIWYNIYKYIQLAYIMFNFFVIFLARLQWIMLIDI